jgi:hypothetical protein
MKMMAIGRMLVGPWGGSFSCNWIGFEYDMIYDWI